MTAPSNLTELRAVRDPAARALAAKAYVAARHEAIREAHAIRDAAILKVLPEHGVTATARMCGVSISHVKALRKAQKEKGR